MKSYCLPLLFFVLLFEYNLLICLGCHRVIKKIAFRNLYSLMIFNSCLKFEFSSIFDIVSPSLKLLIFEFFTITKFNYKGYIFFPQNLVKPDNELYDLVS